MFCNWVTHINETLVNNFIILFYICTIFCSSSLLLILFCYEFLRNSICKMIISQIVFVFHICDKISIILEVHATALKMRTKLLLQMPIQEEGNNSTNNHLSYSYIMSFKKRKHFLEAWSLNNLWRKWQFAQNIFKKKLKPKVPVYQRY